MPEWKQQIEQRLAGLHVDPASEAGIIEEFSQHLEDRYQELLAAGIDSQTARKDVLGELETTDALEAILPLTGLLRKHVPISHGENGTGRLFSDLARDLRYASRALRKNRVFTLFAAATLALGIGANTTVFTIVNTLLLQPLPASDPSRLVAIYSTEAKNSRQSGSLLPISYPNLRDYEARNKTFSDLAGFTPPFVATLSENSGPLRMFGQLATKTYFKTLGLRPALGRFFLPGEDDKPGSAPVAVLSYNAWKGRFGGAYDAIGRKLRINDVVFTVVGVAPRGFLGISAIFGPDVWLPATMAQQVLSADLRDVLSERAKPFFHGVARLKPGVTRSQSEGNLRSIAAALQAEFPGANEGRTAAVRPITDELFSSTGGENSLLLGSVVLLVIVGLVLLIACSNVANLLLVRAAARRQEIAIRLAIGASRSRLVRQLLAESVLLGLLGGMAGLAIGYEGCQVLWSLRPAEVAHNLANPKMDLNVFLFALLVSLITGFVFGVVPALRASKSDVVDALKEEARTAGRERRGVSFANLLLVGQVALSLVSLITAALFLRGIQRAYEIDPGFQTRHLAIFMMNPGQAGYDSLRSKAFYRDLRDRVTTLPGIAGMTWASNLPFWSRASRGIAIEGQEQQKKSEMLTTIVNTVDTSYFSVMRIPLVKGRDFTEADRDDSRPVAIINQEMAAKYWPNGDALGRQFQFPGDKISRQIIGVARNANYTDLGEPLQSCVYLPLRQNFSDSMNLYVRSEADPATILMAVQNEVRNLDPKIQVSDVRTGTKLIDQVLWTAHIVVALLGVFGLLALALASVGLYGVMAYSVNRRKRELGLRMALGAEQGSVLKLVLRQGMTVVCIGVAVGLFASLLIGRVLSKALYGISSADPVSLAAASLVLITVALLACYLPARSASQVDPMLALRES